MGTIISNCYPIMAVISNCYPTLVWWGWAGEVVERGVGLLVVERSGRETVQVDVSHGKPNASPLLSC